MKSIAANYQSVVEKIELAELARKSKGRPTLLLAVSKQQPLDKIKALLNLGQQDFGENYLQEALPKIAAFKEHTPAPIWHYIGQIQSNKTRLIAENFSYVHSVASEKIATRLSEQRPKNLPHLKLLIQINISQEPSKSGIIKESALRLAEHIMSLKNVLLCGLMALPAPNSPVSVYEEMVALKEQWVQLGIAVPWLSMGTTFDYEQAITSGANLVRVGTALFGERKKP